MSAERWQQIQEIFNRAADLPPETQRTVVEEWSRGDTAMVADVLRLLEADVRNDLLLDKGVEQVAASLLDSEPLTALIRRRIGPYRVLEVLGEGGMGVVYLAERIDIGSVVAIKLLRDAWFSPARRERFASEQRMLAQLNHPAIARIYDSGALDDGTPWFVMEHVPGAPLTNFWRTHDGSLYECLRLFRRVCDAVQYAHEHAIVHRDLKPSNILVTDSGEVKLLDFGIAKQIDMEAGTDKRTVAALSMATPAYCAPEQLTGGAVGVFTDVYALGVMLYELLSNQLPFPNGSSKALEEEPERPSIVARRSPAANVRQLTKSEWADFDAICLNALQSRPAERYRSVAALIRDVDAFLKGRPLEARSAGLAYRAGKFIRRHRAGLATTAALLLLAAAAGIFFAVRLTRAHNAVVAEAARTQRIQSFMLDLFGNADQEAAPSNDLKVTTLLERGVQQAASLRADAETQAELYQTLGIMYNRLGQYQKAGELLHLALAKMKQAAGPESVQVARILVLLGVLNGDAGKFKDARQYLANGMRVMAANRLSADSDTALDAQMVLGRVSVQDGSYQKAIQILTPITQLKPPHTDEQSRVIRDSLSALASAELQTTIYDKAKATYTQAIEMDRQILGKSHPLTGADLVSQGSLFLTLREYAAAEKSYREGLAIMTAWYGPNHPDVVTATSFLAGVLINENKLGQAETILRRVLPIEEASYGHVHERVAFTLGALGNIANKRGDLSAAESYFSQAVAIWRSLFGDRNVRTALAKADVAAVYLKESKNAVAESDLREAVATLSVLPSGSSFIGVVRGRWGRSLLALHRNSEAEEQLTAGYQLMKAQLHQPPEFRLVCRSLVKLYEQTGRIDKAKVYKAELAGQGAN